MLETVAIVFLVLWALGLGVGYNLGGFIHLLLVLAVITGLIRLIQGKKLIQ